MRIMRSNDEGQKVGNTRDNKVEKTTSKDAAASYLCYELGRNTV